MAEFKIEAIIGIVVLLAMIVVFAPVIVDSIANGENQYQCQDSVYPQISRNQLLCTNASWGCCGTLKTLNESWLVPLCTNASGVLVANQTACAGFLVYNQSSTHVGISPIESSLLGLSILFIIVGLIIMTVVPLVKKK